MMPTKTKDRLEYEIAKSRHCPDTWLVEAIDYGSEGEIYSATFDGQDAERRAREYAEWKNGGGGLRPDPCR